MDALSPTVPTNLVEAKGKQRSVAHLVRHSHVAVEDRVIKPSGGNPGAQAGEKWDRNNEKPHRSTPGPAARAQPRVCKALAMTAGGRDRGGGYPGDKGGRPNQAVADQA